MARKASPDPPPFQATGPDFKGLLLLLLSIVTLLALLDMGPGLLNAPLARALRWLVGWGAYPIALLVGVAGFLVLFRFRRHSRTRWGRVLAFELLALCLLGVTTLLHNPTLSWRVAREGAGGGAIGWLVANAVSVVGTSGGLILLLLCILLLLPPVLGVRLARLHESLERQKERASARRVKLLAPVQPSAHMALLPAAPQARAPTRSAPTEVEGTARKKGKRSATAADSQGNVLERVKKAMTRATGQAATTGRAKPVKTTMSPAYELPPLDLLNRSSGVALDPNVAREKARVIEKTLSYFGVPATVIQVNQGPAVTQFGVQPGFIETTLSDGTVRRRKVKVSQITSLADDLALALAARSIRVEAPVPGRPYVGIEVPNSDTELVTLHSVLTSDEFQKINSDLAFALGRDVSGHPVAADLARLPHLLIAGATGTGKSV
ncbi:MAG: DNA translocase FtsK 4TM domain-containing protein, partial [Ardenticatenaceae bacterium]